MWMIRCYRHAETVLYEFYIIKVLLVKNIFNSKYWEFPPNLSIHVETKYTKI